eukprot:1156315-Pelagomonas_calceolata.AAC.5
MMVFPTKSNQTDQEPPIPLKQTLYPEIKRQHVQGHILKIFIQLARNSPTPFHSYKVKSHAGITGNECADAIAKHQAIQDDDTPAGTTFPVQTLKAILSIPPPGLPLRKLPENMQVH